MMCDLTQAEPILRADQLRRMLTHRAIPHSARIYAGAWLSLDPLVTNHTVRMDLPDLENPRDVHSQQKGPVSRTFLSSGGRI